MPVAVDTSGRIYDDFSRLLFLHAHREASPLANELQEESEQFRFLYYFPASLIFLSFEQLDAASKPHLCINVSRPVKHLISS